MYWFTKQSCLWHFYDYMFYLQKMDYTNKRKPWKPDLYPNKGGQLELANIAYTIYMACLFLCPLNLSSKACAKQKHRIVRRKGRRGQSELTVHVHVMEVLFPYTHLNLCATILLAFLLLPYLIKSAVIKNAVILYNDVIPLS